MNFCSKINFHNMDAYICDNFSTQPPFPTGAKYFYNILLTHDKPNEHIERNTPILIQNKFNGYEKDLWGFLMTPKKIPFRKDISTIPLKETDQRLFLKAIQNLQQVSNSGFLLPSKNNPALYP